jgi:hypothetical protein
VIKFSAGQVLFEGLSPIGQYVGFNVQKQKIVTYDGVLSQYREFELSSVKSSPKAD